MQKEKFTWEEGESGFCKARCLFRTSADRTCSLKLAPISPGFPQFMSFEQVQTSAFILFWASLLHVGAVDAVIFSQLNKASNQHVNITFLDQDHVHIFRGQLDFFCDHKVHKNVLADVLYLSLSIFSKNHYVYMDVAPWCYKWLDWISPGGVRKRAPYGAKNVTC